MDMYLFGIFLVIFLSLAILHIKNQEEKAKDPVSFCTTVIQNAVFGEQSKDNRNRNHYKFYCHIMIQIGNQEIATNTALNYLGWDEYKKHLPKVLSKLNRKEDHRSVLILLASPKVDKYVAKIFLDFYFKNYDKARTFQGVSPENIAGNLLTRIDFDESTLFKQVAIDRIIKYTTEYYKK